MYGIRGNRSTSGFAGFAARGGVAFAAAMFVQDTVRAAQPAKNHTPHDGGFLGND